MIKKLPAKEYYRLWKDMHSTMRYDSSSSGSFLSKGVMPTLRVEELQRDGKFITVTYMRMTDKEENIAKVNKYLGVK